MDFSETFKGNKDLDDFFSDCMVVLEIQGHVNLSSGNERWPSETICQEIYFSNTFKVDEDLVDWSSDSVMVM